MIHKKGKVEKQGENYVVRDIETNIYYPLKYSQIKAAIDNGEVNSEKVVDFETVDIMDEKCKRCSCTCVCKPLFQVAKIIPQKKRIFTKEDMEKCWQAAKGDIYISGTSPSFEKWYSENYSQ